MPQVATTPARVSRRTVRTVWWTYVAGAVLSGLVIAFADRPSGDGGAGPVVLAVVVAVALLAAAVSFQLTRGLPQAGHRIFDTVGSRFEAAMRNLFIRFLLAGAAAEITGLLGGVLHVLGASPLITATSAGGGLALLFQLRRRAAPLVHYLA